MRIQDYKRAASELKQFIIDNEFVVIDRNVKAATRAFSKLSYAFSMLGEIIKTYNKFTNACDRFCEPYPITDPSRLIAKL